MNVIKLGGSLLDDPARRAEALGAIAAQWNAGKEIVLVHGGGKHVDANLKRLGIPKRTYAGLRITDDATLDVVVATLAGSVNKMLVAELSGMKPYDERFNAKMTVLIENVEHHMDEEENEWFPQVRESLGRKPLQEIGSDLVRAREQAPTSPTQPSAVAKALKAVLE